MPQLNTGSLPQFTDLVKRSWTTAIDQAPNIMRNSPVVVSGAFQQNTGEYKRYAERLDRNQYAAIREEGDTANQALVQYGYELDAQVYTVAMEVSITKRMRVAGKYQDIIDKVTDLSNVCPATIDLDLANRFTFAWSTTYSRTAGYGSPTTINIAVADGFALIYNAHTLTGSSTTYSNQIPANPQFSKGALENAEKLFVEETYNNLGEKLAMKADTIVTTDDLNTCHQVAELMKATADVTSSNAGTINVYKNKYTHVVSERIAVTAAGAPDTTKRKYWFLAASAWTDFYLDVLEEPYLKTPMDGNNGEEFSSENWNYLTAATYLICIVTPKWVKGSKGDGSS